MAKDKKEKKNAEAEETKAEEVTEEVTEEPEQETADERDAKIGQLEKELAAQKDKYMRLAAEYDNYRKRTANEKLSIYDDATGKAVTELLPVADSVRMALENLKDADAEIIKGVELIQTQLGRSFEKLKITTTRLTRSSTTRSRWSTATSWNRDRSRRCSRQAIRSATRSSVTRWFRSSTELTFDNPINIEYR